MKRALTALLSLALAGVGQSARAAEPTKQECATANQEAHRLRKAGKFHEASERLVVSTAQACPGPIRADSAELVEEMKKAQPTMVFAAKDGAGNDVTEVRVAIDGAPVAESLDGSAVLVDPGEHVFRFEAAGVEPLEKKLLILEGEKDRRERVELRAPGAAAPPPRPIARPVPAPMPKMPPKPAAPPSGDGQAAAAIAVGAVGVAGLAAAIATGVIAKSKWNTAQSQHCNMSGDICDDEGVSLVGSAGKLADASTAMFVVGGAAIATSIILGATAPRAKAPVSIGIAPARSGAQLFFTGEL